MKKNTDATLPLFGDDRDDATDAKSSGRKRTVDAQNTSDYVRRNGERLRRWASRGIYFGSSSWKYPGWKGLVYNKPYRSMKMFHGECLTEYSELFPTVCADFALYDFPATETMQMLHDTTTDQFKISLKVTDRITIKQYPNLPRYGANAGRENPDFLNVHLFEDAFLKPIDALKKKRGSIIFEFSTFYPQSEVTYDLFVSMIDQFLSRLPKGFEYAIEIRNSEFLTAAYLQMLGLHGAAHVLNNWTRMPPIIEQIQLAGVLTGKFSVARGLLRPGRTYREAVELFQPYDVIKEENPELRLGFAEAVHRCVSEGTTLYAYLNNRAEGNSPRTIEAILDILENYPVETL
jgi:uncharacterized protein YecE (DUF72 family)